MSISSEISRLNVAKDKLAGKMRAANYDVDGSEKLDDLVGALNLSAAGVDSTPIGSVIYYAGKAAPTGYLACDGAVYDIADYPALAAFFADNYGANNYWGGDGETTFAVPDWQGEFFRAAGTNSRTDEGNGANVGEHQPGSYVQAIWISASGYVAFYGTTAFSTSSKQTDKLIGLTTKGYRINYTTYNASDSYAYYTVRPTNTSLLVCIKAT